MTTLGTVAAWLKPCPSQVLRPVSFLPSLRDSLVLKLTQDLRRDYLLDKSYIPCDDAYV